MNTSRYAIALSLAIASAPSIAMDSSVSSESGPTRPGMASIANLETSAVRFEISKPGKPWAMYRLQARQTREVPCFKKCLIRIAAQGGAVDSYALLPMQRYALRYDPTETAWVVGVPRGKVEVLPILRTPSP